MSKRRPDRREFRHAAALKRAEERATRTDEEQLARLDEMGVTATRERARLQKRIDAAADGKR